MNHLKNIALASGMALALSGEQASPVVAHPVTPIGAAGVMPMPGAKPNSPQVLRAVPLPDTDSEAVDSNEKGISLLGGIELLLGTTAAIGVIAYGAEKYINDGL